MREVTSPPDFTWAAYRHYLRFAHEHGWRFAHFREAFARHTSRHWTIYLRHDIDFSPRWIEPLAEIEQQEGVRATYCLQPDSPNYQLSSSAVRAAVRGLLDRGHWLGLHFDATRIPSDQEVVRRVGNAARALATEFQAPVDTVSFHMAARRSTGHLELPDGLLNTYAPRFFDAIAYVSDSNQNWRGKKLLDVLARPPARELHLLIHPMWWREHPARMIDKLRELADELQIDLEQLLTPEQRLLACSDAR